MAETTNIQWSEATWSPITGCSILSSGCMNCYAMRLAGTRLKHHPSRVGLTQPSKNGPVWTGELRFNEQWLDQPRRWRRPRMIFVCAHSDLFLAPPAWVERVFAVMRDAPQHTYQVLTKRSALMEKFMRGVAPLPNVWMGVSVENQEMADDRIPDLLATPAAVRWVSYEPALGPVDFTTAPARDRAGWLCPMAGDHQLQPIHADHRGARLDWIVIGGESRQNKEARDFDLAWARKTVADCRAAGVPVFVKQLGSNPVDSSLVIEGAPAVRLRDKHGGDITEWPEDLRIREWPRILKERLI